MCADKKPPFLVQAVYSFKGTNNDELCFKKHDVITVTQVEEGGWWEGTLKDKTGWFPSNYVECKSGDSDSALMMNALSKSSADLTVQQSANRTVIIRDLIDSEKAHVAELENLVDKFLVPICNSGLLTRDEYKGLVSNITEIVEVHQNLLKNLIECSTISPEQQRIGRIFLTFAANVKQTHQKYCSTHPRAIMILEKFREDLNIIMETNGASSPGILVLIAGLSKPFRRLEKYHGILQELKRYMEECHFDRGDVLRSISVYKDFGTTCSTIRRQKELELQILNGGVHGWEGDLSALGEIIRIGSVAIGSELKDRYLVLFPDTLLILSVSNTMTSFMYEGKLPLTGITVSKLDDSDEFKNAFEIKSSMIEEIVAICQTKGDQQAWVKDISKQITASKQSSFGSTSSPTSIKTSSSSYSSSQSTSIPPKPPLHAVSFIPYVRLTMYLARLVRKKVITRKVLKRLLYKEYTRRYDTSVVPRRHIHRSEYVIFPEKVSITWLSTSSGSSLLIDEPIATNDTQIRGILPRSVTDEGSLGTDVSSDFDYIDRPVYRTTLTMNSSSCDLTRNPSNLICEDLSKLDDCTRVRYLLGGDDENFHREIRQSEPVHNLRMLGDDSSSAENLHSSDFKSFSIDCGNFCTSMLPDACDYDLAHSIRNKAMEKRYCSYYDIATPNVSSCEKLNNVKFGHDVPKTAVNGQIRDDSMERKDYGKRNNSSRISVRSSDSGLADVTSPSLNAFAHIANIESDNSSNFETQCTCSSPFETTPYTSTFDEKSYLAEYTTDTIPESEPITFKSGMYAHWWLKTKIPVIALKARSSPKFGTDTGKASSRVMTVYLFVE